MTVAARERIVERREAFGWVCAFTAALSYGASNVLTRQSVDELAPLVGSMVALFAGTFGLLAISARNLGSYGTSDPRRGLLFFALAGIFSTVGLVFLFLALDRAAVVVVTPVSSTSPLFTLIFAALLLRGVERLTARVVLGAALVVAGVIVLTVA